MIEDFTVRIRSGRAEPTGYYEITRRGTRKPVLRYRETYQTKAGNFTPEEWKKRVRQEIEAAGEIEMLEKIKEHCRLVCVWLKKESEIEMYAMECLCSRAYLHWEDFAEENDGRIYTNYTG